MPRLSIRRFLPARSRKIGNRELAASPTSVVKPSRTDDQVQPAVTLSNAASGSSTKAAVSETFPAPTPASQPASDVPQPSQLQPEGCEAQACNEPELPAPYATIFDLWNEALQSLKTSGEGENVVAIEKLMGELDGDPSKRPNAKMLATELQEIVDGPYKEQQHDSKAARIIEKTLPVLMKFASVADVAVSVDPLHAALPWAAVRFVLMGLAAGIELRSQILATITMIASLFVQCDKHQQLYLASDLCLRPPEDAMQSLKASIVQAYAKSQVFLSFAFQQPRSASRHLVAPFKLSEVESHIKDLSKCGEELLRTAEYCENCCNFCNRSHVVELLEFTKNSHQSIQDQVKIILDRMDEEEQIKMLEWISSVQYGKHHTRVEEARTSDTCEWLLQHENFCEWERANSSVILWLQGSPGAGKTFLTSKVISHTRKRLENSPNQEGFAFFYCDRDDQERRDPLSVLKSYVRQLSTTVENPDCVRPQLLGLYKKRRQNASKLSFDDCASQLLQSVNLYRKTTLVLDALDECEPDSRKKIIKTIEVLLSKSERPLKVFISSRPDRDIRSKFLDKPNIEIQAMHNEEDIKKFVKEEIINHGGWEDMSANLQSKIAMALLQQSDGMFQWAFLQIKQILSLETEAAILDRIGKLPPDLKTAYDDIYAGIKARHEHDRALADNAFKWVMCAVRPLDSSKLLQALRIDSEKDTFELSESITESKLLHLCNNLLVIDSQRGVWRFSHLSVAEYFENNHWSRSKAHSYSAKVCLKLLMETYQDLDDIPEDLSDGLFDDSSDDFRDPGGILNLYHPLQEYVQYGWITHIQGQEGEEADPVLTGLLKSFLGSPQESSLQYRRWFQLSEGDEYISPKEIALFAICRFSFYNVLLDWWEHAEFEPWQKSNSGYDLLSLAVIGGCKPICENLMKRGLHANSRYPQCLDIALITAIWHQQTEMAKFLVSEGANVNAIIKVNPGNWDGTSPLATAVELERMEIAQFLLQEGADVNMHLPHGNYGSALVAAVVWGDVETVKLLLDAGADVNQRSQVGNYRNALIAACTNRHGNEVKIAQLLLDAGADVNQQNHTGKYGNALVAASGRGLTEVVKLLLDAGADVNQQSQSEVSGSALAVAALSGEEECADALIKAGANVNLIIENQPFRTALEASQLRSSEAERLLGLWYYNSEDRKAIDKKRAEITELLRLHGAIDGI